MGALLTLCSLQLPCSSPSGLALLPGCLPGLVTAPRPRPPSRSISTSSHSLSARWPCPPEALHWEVRASTEPREKPPGRTVSFQQPHTGCYWEQIKITNAPTFHGLSGLCLSPKNHILLQPSASSPPPPSQASQPPPSPLCLPPLSGAEDHPGDCELRRTEPWCLWAAALPSP